MRPPDGVPFRGLGWLTAYVPGQRETRYPPNHGRRIPAGSKLVFQQHYTPVGSQQSDITKIGLIFADDSEIKHEVFTTVAIDQEFEIPPGADSHSVSTDVRFLPKEGKLFGFAPHMHYRGKSCEISVVRAGESTKILDVPRYDFNWQHSYMLKQPMKLSDVERITFSATFDNSADNPVNPNPGERVYWGDQTWEEMVVAFFDVSVPLGIELEYERATVFKLSESEERKMNEFLDEFMDRFDKNRDGSVMKLELPHSMRRNLMYYDDDEVPGLQREELQEAVEWDFTQMEEAGKQESSKTIVRYS